MRRSLYVKDEDVRLSFLHGQYVTFSDISEEEIRKILRYRLSPLYVSIHTTDPLLRGRMLGNPHAADGMEVLRRVVAPRVLHDSPRAIPRPRGAGGAYLPPAWASPLARGHPRRGEGDACHARAAAPPPGGPGGGTLRRGRRRILPDGGGTNPRAPRVRIVRADRQRGGIAAELFGRLARALPAEEVEEGGCGGNAGQRRASHRLRFRFLGGSLPA